MNILKNNMWTLAALAFVLTFTLSGGAAAETVTGSSVMGVAEQKAAELFNSVKTIIFVVGGFGLIALAFAAIFGKVKWSWFAGLAFGLAVLAAAGSIVDYATGTNTHAGSNSLDDSFGSTL